MKAKDRYKKETGKDAFNNIQKSENINFKFDNVAISIEYLQWLENQVEKTYEPSILTWIKTMFEHAEKKEWFETYWSFDIHGTISKPDYRKDTKEIIYYPYAKETLQLLSERKDIVMILFTSSYPDEVKIYQDTFEKDNINFNYVGENPEVSDAKGSFGYYEKKHYFNVFLEDKAGFKPERDWEFIYDYLMETKYRPDQTWSKKYKEDYHK